MNDRTIAVVTGASRGIGLATARMLGDAGLGVIGTATGPAGLDTIENALAPSGALAAALQLDVTDADSIDAFFSELEARALSPLVVVNNAGITRDNLMLRMKDEEWNAVISANLGSVFRLSKRFLRPMLKARYGRIVNVTSVVGNAGNAGQANYAAAKAGVVGLTKSLAQEVANRGITVNAVAPGFIDTDMTAKLSDDQKAAALAQIPMSRMGNPDEIASAICFLASDGAAYITGETIHVNGGMYMA